MLQFLFELCDAARLNHHQRAVIDFDDGYGGRIGVFRREVQRGIRIGQTVAFGTFAEQLFINLCIAASLSKRSGNFMQRSAVRGGVWRKGNGFHAILAIQGNSLRVLRFLFGGGKIERRCGRHGRAAGGEQLLELAVGHGLRRDRRLRIECGLAGIHRFLKRSYADRVAGRRVEQQRQRFVGEIRVGGEIQRCAVRIGGQRRDDGSAAGCVVLRGGKGIADQRQHFPKRQPVIRQKMHQQAAVALGLGGEKDVAVSAGSGGKNGQHIRQRTGNAVDFVAQRVIEHRIAVSVDQHFARHGRIGIEDGNAGISLNFLDVEPNRARRAGYGRARESDTEDPGARAAHAKRPRLVGVDGGIEVKGAGRIDRGGGQRKPRTSRAGNQRRHTGKHVIRMCVCARCGARHIHREGMSLRQDADHIDRLQIRERHGAGENLSSTQFVVADLRDADVGELPVAGLRRLAQRGQGKQAQQHQQPNGNKTLHTEKSLLSPSTLLHLYAAGFGIVACRTAHSFWQSV